jgi:hypothetical protein
MFRYVLSVLKVSVRKRMPIPIRKKPLTRTITFMYRLNLAKADRNELKAREQRKKGIPNPSE